MGNDGCLACDIHDTRDTVIVCGVLRTEREEKKEQEKESVGVCVGGIKFSPHTHQNRSGSKVLIFL